MHIFIGIDLQNDFIDEKVLGTPEAAIAVAKIAERLGSPDKYAYDYYIFTLDNHFNAEQYLDTPEGINLPVPHCLLGTKGEQLADNIVESLKSNSNTQFHTFFIHKNSFFTPKLAEEIQLLYAHNCRFIEDQGLSIEIAGLCTDICVISNALALRGYFPEAYILIREPLCAGTSPQAHQAALKIMSSNAINILYY